MDQLYIEMWNKIESNSYFVGKITIPCMDLIENNGDNFENLEMTDKEGN